MVWGSGGVGHRRSSDPALLWLWCKLAAIALIWSLAWEPLYATGATLKRQKKKKEKKKRHSVAFLCFVNLNWTKNHDFFSSLCLPVSNATWICLYNVRGCCLKWPECQPGLSPPSISFFLPLIRARNVKKVGGGEERNKQKEWEARGWGGVGRRKALGKRMPQV